MVKIGFTGGKERQVGAHGKAAGDIEHAVVVTGGGQHRGDACSPQTIGIGLDHGGGLDAGCGIQVAPVHRNGAQIDGQCRSTHPVSLT